MSKSPEIIIESYGSVSALGITDDEIKSSLSSGNVKIGKMEVPSLEKVFPVYPISESSDTALKNFIENYPKFRHYDRAVQLGLLAAKKCIDEINYPAKRVGVIMGTSRGTTNLLEQSIAKFNSHLRLPTATSPRTTFGVFASSVATLYEERFNCSEVINVDISMTCSSALVGIANAVAWIRAGMADSFIVGGAEAPLTEFTLAQMDALKIYTPFLDDPNPCKPLFSLDSKSREWLEQNPKNKSLFSNYDKLKTYESKVSTFCLGEGAAVFHVRAVRDDEKLGGNFSKVLGVGFAREQVKSGTGITPNGDAFFNSATRAMADAGITTGDINSVVLHAPGTVKGDQAEINSLEMLFEVGKVPEVLSPKGVCGHTFGASGGLGIVNCYSENQIVFSTGFGGQCLSVLNTH